MKAKREVHSVEEVYTNSTLRHIAWMYSQPPIEPEDLLQEAALAVWEAQRAGKSDPGVLFLEARGRMWDVMQTGKSIDRTWPKARRPMPIYTETLSEYMEKKKTWGGDKDVTPEERLLEDRRSPSLPDIIASRDLLERICAYDGYTALEKAALWLFLGGYTSAQVREEMGIDGRKMGHFLDRLRGKILLKALRGEQSPWPSELRPYLTEKEEKVFDHGRIELGRVATKTGWGRGVCRYYQERIQRKVTLFVLERLDFSQCPRPAAA